MVICEQANTVDVRTNPIPPRELPNRSSIRLATKFLISLEVLAERNEMDARVSGEALLLCCIFAIRVDSERELRPTWKNSSSSSRSCETSTSVKATINISEEPNTHLEARRCLHRSQLNLTRQNKITFLVLSI